MHNRLRRFNPTALVKKIRDRWGWQKSLAALLIFIGLFALTMYYYAFQGRTLASTLIAQQTALLRKTFEKIDNHCGISSFDFEKNYITFLTVKSFVGTAVGPMHVTNPDQWRGPYLKDNPTLQGHYYYVLKHKDGYYIVPGDGVVLRGKKVLGRDIEINNHTNIDALLTQHKASLMHQGKPLIVKLELRKDKHSAQQHETANARIVRQVNTLRSTLKKIDTDCRILSFDLEKNYITFLTVEAFAGSEVGAMNIAYPTKWHGPYAEETPTIQGKYYYVLKHKDGYYIVPDDGVRLRGNKVLGQDIVITSTTDIDALIKQYPMSLTYNNKPLIQKLDLRKDHIAESLNLALQQ